MAEEKIPTQDMETVETEQKTKSEEPKEITEASKEHKTKKFGFPFHFWKKKKEKDTDKMKQEEKKEEATEMKEETPGAESGTAKQESDLDQNANKTPAESIPMKETKERKDSVSSSSSSSQDEKNKQNDEEEKKSYAEAVSAKQSAPTQEQPKMDIPKPETETKKSSSKKGIFSIFHRKPSKEKEPETVKAPTETTQETSKTVNQPEMADNAIADKTEESAKETAEENKVIKEEPKPEVKTAGVEGPEDGSESTMKAGEPKAAEETKQAEDTEAKEIPKEVSEKQGGGFFHKFLRAFGCGGDISKENTQPRPQATVA